MMLSIDEELLFGKGLCVPGGSHSSRPQAFAGSPTIQRLRP